MRRTESPTSRAQASVPAWEDAVHIVDRGPRGRAATPECRAAPRDGRNPACSAHFDDHIIDLTRIRESGKLSDDRQTPDSRPPESGGALPRRYLTGPRQSGKTTLVRVVFPEYRYASLEAPDMRARAIADPRGFLARAATR